LLSIEKNCCTTLSLSYKYIITKIFIKIKSAK